MENQPTPTPPPEEKSKEGWPEIRSFNDLLSFVADLALDILEAIQHARRGIDNLVRRRKRREKEG